MPTNHTKSMSQPERSFWKEVFLVVIQSKQPISFGVEQEAAHFADKAVQLLRERTTWRQS